VLGKIFRSIVLVILSFVSWATVAHADSHDTQKNIQWLYMVTSHKASVKSNNGDMQIVVPLDSSCTAGFGDRPARIVQKMTIEDLASLWDEGENSFSKDPPNAGMYMAKKHGIVVLKSLLIENSNAVFTFTMDDNSQDTFVSGDTGVLALVIDKHSTAPNPMD